MYDDSVYDVLIELIDYLVKNPLVEYYFLD